MSDHEVLFLNVGDGTFIPLHQVALVSRVADTGCSIRLVNGDIIQVFGELGEGILGWVEFRSVPELEDDVPPISPFLGDQDD